MTEALELQPSLSDGDLARAAADGDRQAFAEIYDRYADRLYDFCVGLIGDRDAAADCVQDAFCVAATDLGGLREPDKLRPWLYSIARHHAMRRLRHRYREEVSDELPDMVSHEASPETLAGQSDLARLVADAAGGLSDRDRELLELSYRHGLDGPELAEALGVSLTSANTMMFRLRQTVERCLGALLVARGARTNPDACPALAAVLKGWDGQFSVLMRKRMARHIDSCPTCEQDQRQHVNPVALLGGAPVFIPAPDWLRRQTLDRVQLTCASSSMTETSGQSVSSGTTDTSGDPTESRRIGKRLAVIVGIPLLCLSVAIPWFTPSEDPVFRVVDTGADSSDGPVPVMPAAVKRPPPPGHLQSVGPAGAARAAVPTRQAETAPGARTPGATAPNPAPGANTPRQAPGIVLPDTGPNVVAPTAPRIDSAPVPNSDSNVSSPGSQVDPVPVTVPEVSTTAPQGGTTSVTNPTGSTSNPQGSLGTIPNPNLNTKVVSPYPQTNTATITGPTGTIPNLQVNTLPKPNTTNIGPAPKPNTNTGTAPKPNTTPNTNMTGSTNTNTNSGGSTNTNSKSTTSTK